MAKIEGSLGRGVEEENEIDPQVGSLLERLNSIPAFRTSSSCSGRIVLLQTPEAGDKLGARFLGKWHEAVSPESILEAAEPWRGGEYMYFLCQAPNIHVITRELTEGVRLRNMAVEAGLKYSNLKSISLDGKDRPTTITVELLSSENLEVPLCTPEKSFLYPEFIELLGLTANRLLERGHGKLKRLEDVLQRW